MSFTKEIPFDLTDDEVREYSEQLARGIQDIEGMKGARKIEVKQRNVEILELQDQVDDLADKVINRTELREVECEWRKDFDAAMMVMVRLDTLEIVDSRPMDEDEKQLGLPMQDGADKDEDKAA